MLDPAGSSPDSETNSHDDQTASVTDTLVNRRHLLAGVVGSVGLLSGCLDLLSSDGTDTPSTVSPTATRTENPTETVSPTATRTENRIETASPTATSAPTVEQPTETQTGGGSLTFSPVETYTNANGYSIDYPAHWTVYEASDDVEIANADYDGIRVLMESSSTYPGTIDQIADQVIESIRSRSLTSSLSKEGETTIKSGHSAMVVHGPYDLEADQSELLRSTFFIVATENAVFIAEFVADDADWSSTVRNEVRDLLTSLTISGSGNTSV